MFQWEQDTDGIVVVTMDDPEQAVNTANDRFRRELPLLLSRLESQREGIRGVVLASSKRTFFAGADLSAFATAGPDDVADVQALLDELKVGFRRIETLGVPVVAAINGAALGGGCELSLSCHRRILVNRPDVVVGLPEVSLGLLPGAGGVVRTVRMFGLEKAIQEILVPGTRFTATAALEVGIVDEVVETDDELMVAARRWLATEPAAVQPWDAPDYCIPHGAPSDPRMARILSLLPAVLRKQTRGAPNQALEAIVAAAVESATLDFDSAQAIESRYCAGLVGSQVSSNIIQGTFFDVRTARTLAAQRSRSKELPLHSVLVLGENPLSHDIAKACKKVGLDVTVTDGLSGVPDGDFDLLLESITEDLDTRTAILAEVAKGVVPTVPVATNSSAVSLAELARCLPDPAILVGLHFFTPVERMELVEVAARDTTHESAVVRALELARALKKTAIVVGDASGFYANQVLAAFLSEALRMVDAGIPAVAVEQAAFQGGFKGGALALIDAISLNEFQSLMSRLILDPADAEAPQRVLSDLIDNGRLGRSSGAGFYDYTDGKRAGLWCGMPSGAGSTPVALDVMKERILFAGALVAARCLERGIVRTVPEGNVGSLLGVGFPAWTGGALQYIAQYPGGVHGFVRRARELAGDHGARFEMSDDLANHLDEALSRT